MDHQFFWLEEFSNSLKFFTRSLTLLVLNGPGAILIIDIPCDEKELLSDFKTLLNPILSEDDIIKFSDGSFIIEDDIRKI